MTSPIGGTHFRRNEHGKVVGLDWTKHDDGKRADPNAPKPKPKPKAAPKPRVKAGTCKHGHDVTSPDARYQNGQCKECVARRSRERQERRRAERIAAGLPVAHRDPTTCKRGHDVTLPGALSTRGECLECAREASREWYRRRRAKGPRPPAGERVTRRGSEVIEEAAYLAEMGFALTGVLAELDMKRDTFYKACCRHNARDLYKRLALREPNAYRYAR